MRQRSGALTDDAFELVLGSSAAGYPYVSVGASLFSAAADTPHGAPKFKVNGRRATWLKHGFDPQEARLKTGDIPSQLAWLAEPDDARGFSLDELDRIAPGNPVVYAKCDYGAPRTIAIYWQYDTMPVTQPDGSSSLEAMRFVGGDGPRWFARGLITGPGAHDRTQAGPIEDLFADLGDEDQVAKSKNRRQRKEPTINRTQLSRCGHLRQAAPG
mgnify:CR=1 FL=1